MSHILYVYNYPFKDGNSDCGIWDITTDTVRDCSAAPRRY